MYELSFTTSVRVRGGSGGGTELEYTSPEEVCVVVAREGGGWNPLPLGELGYTIDLGRRNAGVWWGRGCCCNWRALIRGRVLLERENAGKDMPLVDVVAPTRAVLKERVLLPRLLVWELAEGTV